MMKGRDLMLCQSCKQREATSHIHSVINGVVQDTYLCPECAIKIKNGGFSNDGLFDLVSSFFKGDSPYKSELPKCDCCGMTFEEISKKGRVGCPNCYLAFRRELEPSLLRIHGRTVHVGKKPSSLVQESVSKELDKEKSRIEMLRDQLKSAIENEEYEKAAVLRDEIRKAQSE